MSPSASQASVSNSHWHATCNGGLINACRVAATMVYSCRTTHTRTYMHGQATQPTGLGMTWGAMGWCGLVRCRCA